MSNKIMNLKRTFIIIYTFKEKQIKRKIYCTQNHTTDKIANINIYHYF